MRLIGINLMTRGYIMYFTNDHGSKYKVYVDESHMDNTGVRRILDNREVSLMTAREFENLPDTEVD